MKSGRPFLLACLMIVLYASFIDAVGISPPLIRLNFEPSAFYTFDFTVIGAENIQIAVDGDLANYTNVSKTILKNNEHFTVTLHLPEFIQTPGEHVAYITATEMISSNATIAGVASIRTPIYVQVPYPGRYASISFDVNDVSLNETVRFYITMNNLGTDNIEKAYALITVFDLDGAKIVTTSTEEKGIPSKTSATLLARWNTTHYKPGSYKAQALVFYDQDSKTLEKDLRIGTLHVDILNYTDTFYNHTIAPFYLNIESRWNIAIQDLYATISIFNDFNVKLRDFKTMPSNLQRFEQATLQGFLDPRGLGEGAYPITIDLNYENQHTLKNATLHVLAQEKAGLFARLTLPFQSNIVLILIIMLLTLINLFLFFQMKKKKQEMPPSKNAQV